MAVKTITTGRQKETKAEWLEYILFKAGRGGHRKITCMLIQTF